MIQTKFVDKINTHILYSKLFFLNRAFLEKVWKNIENPKQPQLKT